MLNPKQEQSSEKAKGVVQGENLPAENAMVEKPTLDQKRFEYYFSIAGLTKLAMQLDVPPQEQQDVLRRYAKEVVEGVLKGIKCPESAGALLNMNFPTSAEEVQNQLKHLVSKIAKAKNIGEIDEADFALLQDLVSRIRKEVIRLVEGELEKVGLERKVGVLGQKFGEGGFGRVFNCRLGSGDVAAKLIHAYVDSDDDLTYYKNPQLIKTTKENKHLVRYFGSLKIEQEGNKNLEFKRLDFMEALPNALPLNDYLLKEMGTEKVGWGNLKEFLRKIFLPALDGVKALHDQGLVHSDIKGNNIFVTRGKGEPEVKVGDYDLTRHSGFLNPDKAKIIGSPTNMSPEQWQGKALTEKSDIYSLGMMLYYLFGGLKQGEINDEYKRAMGDVDVSLLECPRMLQLIISLCLRVSPEKRLTIDKLISGIYYIIEDPSIEAEIHAHLPENKPVEPMLSKEELKKAA